MSKPDSEKKEEKHQKTKSHKPKEPAEPKSARFPAEGKLNKYGFFYLNHDLLNAWLGHGKGMEQELSVDLKDDKLVISKA